MSEVKPPGPPPRLPAVWRDTNIKAQTSWMSRAFRKVDADLGEALERARCDAAAKYPRAGGERTSGGRYDDDGSVPGPVPGFVLALNHAKDDDDPDDWDDDSDQVRAKVSELVQAVVDGRSAASRALAAAAELRGLDPEKAKKLVEDGTTGAECANPACPIVVAGTRADRLISGRCLNCWKYRRKNHLRERPRELCVLEAVKRGQFFEDQAVKHMAKANAEPSPEFWAQLHAYSGADH